MEKDSGKRKGEGKSKENKRAGCEALGSLLLPAAVTPLPPSATCARLGSGCAGQGVSAPPFTAM